MIIINDIEHLNKSIRFHKHEGKTIGKLDINYNKALTDKFYLHQGHLDCIKKLKESGCDYIMIECINSINCFKSINEKHSNTESTMTGYFDYDEEIIDNKQLEEYCKNLNIDYLIINSNDYNIQIPDKIIKDVDNIIKYENYISDLKLTKRESQLLRVNLIVRTFRSLSIPNGVTYIKCYKDGAWVFALKHYSEKYLNNKFIIIEPTLQPDSFIPLSSTDKTKYFENVNLLFKYFYYLNDEKYKEKLEISAKNLNLDIDIKTISNKKYINKNYINITFTYKNNKYGMSKLIGGL